MADYEIPSYGSSPSRVHGWLLEALQEGQTWLRQQRPTVEWDRLKDICAPDDGSDFLPDSSNTGFRKTKRIARELVASLSNFQYSGEYRVEFDQTLYDAAEHLTKRDNSWFRQTHAHAALRSIIQYGVVFGTGWAYSVWDKSYWGAWRGDVRMTAMAPDDVFCVQLPKDNDFQRAYCVIIKEELPINLARRIYAWNPAFSAQLQPDRDTPGWIDRGLKKIQSLLGGSPVFKYLNQNDKRSSSFPTVDIFHVYSLDTGLNVSGNPITMGALDTNWSYQVPSLGGLTAKGETAGPDDARLFPLRRYSIFARSVPFPAYDGSSPWWHGQVPLARFRFNDWAWEALGQSLVGDVHLMEKGIESVMRDVEDSCHARLDPPVAYDDERVAKGFADAVNPRKAGVRVAASLNSGEMFKVLGEQWQYEVPNWVQGWIKDQEVRMDYLAGTPDLIAIAKARQVPSEGTLEKLLEMAGPLVQDMIRGVEAPLYDLGEMRKSYYLQFDTRARWMSLSGPGTDDTDFYFNPDLIVPAGPSTETAAQTRDRRKLFLHQFHYHLSQSGVNELHRMSNKLLYLQLMKAGFPISWWTFAKIAQIPNFGPEPTGENGRPVSNELERWIAQQRIMHNLAEDATASQVQAQAAGAQAAGLPAGTVPPKPTGRPPTNQAPPRLVQKDGGTRSTVTTS